MQLILMLLAVQNRLFSVRTVSSTSLPVFTMES